MIFCVITLGDVLPGLKLLFRVIPVSTIILLAALVAGIGLGLFQLIGLLKQFKIVSEDKLAGLEEKLALVKIPLGFLSIGAGVYLLLWRIIKWSF